MPDRAAKKVVTAWTERLEPLYQESLPRVVGGEHRRGPRDDEALPGGARPSRRPATTPTASRGSSAPSTRASPTRCSPGRSRSSGATSCPSRGPRRSACGSSSSRPGSSERFSTVRGSVRGRALGDNEIAKILKQSDDVALREEAWRASKEVGAAVAADVRELARLRNRVAQALGVPDHYTIELARQDIDPAWLDEFLTRMDAAPTRAVRGLQGRRSTRASPRASASTPDALRPWHSRTPSSRRRPRRARPSFDRLFAGRDLVDLTVRTYDAHRASTSVPRSSAATSLPRAGKCQHAFCTHIDRRGDVRVLCNNVPNERWMGTMLHEFGHAIYDLEIDRALPWVLRAPPHMSSTEAIAMLFGRLSKDAVVARAGARAVARRGEGGRGGRRPRVLRGDARLRAVGAGDGAVRARALRRPRARPRHGSGGTSSSATSACSAPTAARRPTGRRRSTSRPRPSTTTAYLMGECTASQLLHHVRATTGRGLVGNRGGGRVPARRVLPPGSTRLLERAPRGRHGASARSRPSSPTSRRRPVTGRPRPSAAGDADPARVGVVLHRR